MCCYRASVIAITSRCCGTLFYCFDRSQFCAVSFADIKSFHGVFNYLYNCEDERKKMTSSG